jgi:hypothetical protein
MLSLIGNIIRQIQKYKIGTPQATTDEVKEFLLRWYVAFIAAVSITINQSSPEVAHVSL